jgi:hypothetical protein
LANRAALFGWIIIAYVVASYVVALEQVLWYALFGSAHPHANAPLFIAIEFILAPVFAPYVLMGAISNPDALGLAQGITFLLVFGALIYIWRQVGTAPQQPVVPHAEPPNL